MGTTRELRILHKQLSTLVEELTHKVSRKVIRADGAVSTHNAASWLSQLEDAIANSTGRGGGRGSGRPIPISPDAADIKAAMDRSIQDAFVQAMLYEHNTTAARITALGQLGATWADDAWLTWLAGRLTIWVEQIRALLDPQQRLHIAAACPACGTRMVWRQQPGNDELVQTPALQVDAVNGCNCLACGHVWPTTASLEGLATWIAHESAIRDGDPHNYDPEDALVEVCRCGLWPGHHIHTSDPATCTCEACRSEEEPDSDDGETEPRCGLTELEKRMCAHCKGEGAEAGADQD